MNKFPSHWLPLSLETAEHGGFQVINKLKQFICWCDNTEVAEIIVNLANKEFSQ
jgi:hypothetical protein